MMWTMMRQPLWKSSKASAVGNAWFDLGKTLLGFISPFEYCNGCSTSTLDLWSLYLDSLALQYRIYSDNMDLLSRAVIVEANKHRPK